MAENTRLVILIRSTLVLALMVVSATAFGQPGDPGGDPDVPITGLEYLIGGGALFGIRTLLKRMKQKGD
jgi:hypothetical protein